MSPMAGRCSFYLAMGYIPLEELQGIWAENPCLILRQTHLGQCWQASSARRSGGIWTCSESIDRNVRSRVVGELGAFPVGMPALELETGQLRHQIKLCGPDIAVWAAKDLRFPTLVEVKVV